MASLRQREFKDGGRSAETGGCTVWGGGILPSQPGIGLGGAIFCGLEMAYFGEF